MTTEARERPERLRLTPMTVVDRHHDCLFRIDQLIEERKKTTSMGLRDLRKIRKMIEALTKDTTKILSLPTNLEAPRRVSPPGWQRPVAIDGYLRKFLKLSPGEEVTSREVMVAISTYVHLPADPTPNRQRWVKLNPSGRDLRDPRDHRVINPDATLNRLLLYDEYRARVARGEETIERDHPIYARKERVVITDDSLRWWVVTKLIWQRMTCPKVGLLKADLLKQTSED